MHSYSWRRFILVINVAACSQLIRPVVQIDSSYPYGVVVHFPTQPDKQYLVASQPVSTAVHAAISKVHPPSLNNLIPTTIIQVESPFITAEDLQYQLDHFGKVDDVWSSDFLESLTLSYRGEIPATFDRYIDSWLHKRHIKTLFISGSIPLLRSRNIQAFNISLPQLPHPGPFIFSGKGSALSLYNVYRLYPDYYDGFLFGAIPNLLEGGWIPTNTTRLCYKEDDTAAPQMQMIPVSSRLNSLISDPNLPLLGKRFGLKDIYDAQGLPTAAGSHAYQLTHSTPNVTAPSIKKLVALGASMIGKTRTSQFAHGAQPWEFVDVPYSWNPRGDGHLTASASSSGSACAIAAYGWLDFTVGSDTRGSVRKPAALVGAYGIRPSHGSMDLTGVVPLSEEMDTAGFFTRDPSMFFDLASQWYIDSPVAMKGPTSRFPRKLLFPVDHFPANNSIAQRIIDGFVQSLELHFRIIKSPVNMTETLVPFLPNGSFPQFQLSSNKLAEYHSWMNVGKPTIQEYVARFGSLPTFDPVPEMVFARAQSISDKEFGESVSLKRQFSRSLSEHVFKPSAESCADSIFIYDAATGGRPSYRVEEFNSLDGATPFLLTAVGADREARASDFFSFLASMGELPEVTVPIGQVEYFSPVSRTWEPLPIAIQLVTRKGCDQVLVELVKALADRGVIRSVKVGRAAF